LWIVLVLFATIAITFLMHDIGLNVEIIKLGFTDAPEIRLENIRFERDIFESHWRISIPSLERRKEITKISSVNIFREFSNGDIWEIRGDNGEYIESSEIAMFREVSGRMIMDGRAFDLYAPTVLWEKSGDLVVFLEGIAINGEFSSVSADKAKVEAGNLITIEGGEIIWNFLSYDIRI
jgi:hypothetical protein